MREKNKQASWLNSDEYPFKSYFMETAEGRLHYIDEGEGEVLLFIHGTPTWSFLYRNYFKALRKNYRCIALDHLGFGLSDKPSDFAGTPEYHAKNLSNLIEMLDLKDITLIVHDFGGPIGLSYAVDHPENIKKVVLFNTWMWATKDNPDAIKVDKILHSKVGNFLYLNTNFSPNFLFKRAFHDRSKLKRSIHLQYRRPFSSKESRTGLLNIGKSLIGSSDWYETLWSRVEGISDLPFLILWGTKDIFINEEYLDRWSVRLNKAQVHRFEAGHFVQEEKVLETIKIIIHWL